MTAELEAHDIFHALVELVAPAQIDLRDDNPKFTSRLAEGLLFLCSDFGWSVFLSTVDNKDPAEIRPELVKVCKGTPTKINTNERRLRIRDGLGRITVYYPEYATIQRQLTYTPRSAVRAIQVSQYWSTTEQEFEMTFFYSVELGAEWKTSAKIAKFEHLSSCRDMLYSIWETFLTKPCSHEEFFALPRSSARLGPEAAAVLGWRETTEDMSRQPERILVFLTRGNPHARWLAVTGQSSDRMIMLRTATCCDECALEYVASLPGRWILVL